jgi:hypothetical protein
MRFACAAEQVGMVSIPFGANTLAILGGFSSNYKQMKYVIS